MRRKFSAFLAAVAVAGPIWIGFKNQEAKAQEASCSTTITRSNLVRCALGASLASKTERLGLESLEGRRRAAGVLLPSNPTLSLNGGYPIEPSLPTRPALWGAALSQEVEIAGQRGARLDLVAAERRAQQARLTTVQRDAAIDALTAYFDALSAIEEARIADRLAKLGAAMKAVARGRAQAGVAADVDAKLAESAAIRLAQGRLVAEQRVLTTAATLATIIGQDPAQARLRIEGELTPLAVADTPAPALIEAALARRSDIAMAVAEADTQRRRIALYERLRYPNPTFSVFAKSDWVGERAVGLGVAFPIPFPAPVGRTYAGEIAEATTLTLRAETEADRVRRAVRLEVVKALGAVASRKRQLDLYEPQQIRETEDALRSIADEIEARRLPVRDALLTQQGLIDLLFGYVEARRQLCFASVELARAAGAPLERGDL